MSIETWRKEFYPKPANEVKDVMAALRHSELKWWGLLLEDLKKHNIVHHVAYLEEDNGTDLDGPDFDIDCSTCALCQICRCPINHEEATERPKCPLGNCDAESRGWSGWKKGDANPMLEEIRLAIRKRARK